jgi:glycosyltransferase involved in cell wall biosynthesis
MASFVLGIIPEQGGSISNLARSGQDQRFIDYYLKKYSAEFSRVYYFSYVKETVKLPENCYIINNPGYHRWIYAYFMPLIHRREFKKCSLLRVMQAYGSIPAIISKILYKTPFVVTYGYRYFENAKTNRMKFRPYLFKWRALSGIKHASKVIITSHKMYEYVNTFVPKHLLYYSPNGVDTNLFSPAPSLLRQQIKTILFVGRLAPDKNLIALIDAIKLISCPNVKLIIVGDGKMKPILVEHASNLGSQIKFMGTVPNNQLPDLYRTCDIFILPSFGEGHPKALLEAMSCGAPCIGSDVPGIQNLITDGVTGLLCKQSKDDIAAKINALFENPDLARHLGEMAREYVVKNFDINQIMSKEISMLKEVTNQASR